jgi:quaternary ammonium compound-resistance protein SugE
MSWIILVLAGFLEIAWAIGLKYTEGFTKPWPSLFTLIALALSIYLLAVATRSLPIGTAYSVWVGIGACGTAIVGMVFLGEAVTAARVLCLCLITLSIVGLKFTTPTVAKISRESAADKGGGQFTANPVSLAVRKDQP